MRKDQLAPIRFTDESRPIVYVALLELHLLGVRLLEAARRPASDVSHFRRGTRRALLALGQACAGYRRKHYLALSDAGVVSSLELLHILRAEGHLDARIYDELVRRVQQIRSALDVLECTADDAWSSAELPRREPAPKDPLSVPRGSFFTELLARVEAVVARLMPAATGQPRATNGSAVATDASVTKPPEAPGTKTEQ
jgi:hypothetical protein